MARRWTASGTVRPQLRAVDRRRQRLDLRGRGRGGGRVRRRGAGSGGPALGPTGRSGTRAPPAPASASRPPTACCTGTTARWACWPPASAPRRASSGWPQQGDRPHHRLPHHLHRGGRHPDQTGAAHRPQLRLRGGTDPAHERPAEPAQHRAVLCPGGEVPHRQLSQPGPQPRQVAPLAVPPGTDPGTPGGGPHLDAGDRHRWRAGGLPAAGGGRRARGVPGGATPRTASSCATVGERAGATVASPTPPRSMPRRPSPRRTARCRSAAGAPWPALLKRRWSAGPEHRVGRALPWAMLTPLTQFLVRAASRKRL